jgi:hypothetical protein
MFRASVSLVLMILAVPGLASATSHFTVTNHNNRKLVLSIYDGDDSSCIFDAKGESVDAEETKSFTCTGGGKQRCKVQVTVQEYDDEACSQIASGCGTVALVVIPDGATLVVEANPDYCSIND